MIRASSLKSKAPPVSSGCGEDSANGWHPHREPSTSQRGRADVREAGTRPAVLPLETGYTPDPDRRIELQPALRHCHRQRPLRQPKYSKLSECALLIRTWGPNEPP